MTNIRKEMETLRESVYQSGGMATKSFIEDYAIKHFGIERYEAHEIANDIEFSGYSESPIARGMTTYPDVLLVGKIKRATVVSH